MAVPILMIDVRLYALVEAAADMHERLIGPPAGLNTGAAKALFAELRKPAQLPQKDDGSQPIGLLKS
jgi:hypothetical protein